jgi:hypothetical protein
MSRRRTQKAAVNTPFHKLLSTSHKTTNNNHLAVGAACKQVCHRGHVRPLERAARNNSPPSRAMSLGNDSGDAVKPRPAISIRERLASPHFVLRWCAAHDSCEWVQCTLQHRGTWQSITTGGAHAGTATGRVHSATHSRTVQSKSRALEQGCDAVLDGGGGGGCVEETLLATL